MIRITQKGDFKRTYKFLESASFSKVEKVLDKYGLMGVEALSALTPVDSGKTAYSWDYHIEKNDGNYAIVWTNSNVNDHVNIALILQYGHGTGTGGYVKSIDYINPALKPVYDEIVKEVWEEVTIG